MEEPLPNPLRAAAAAAENPLLSGDGSATPSGEVRWNQTPLELIHHYQPIAPHALGGLGQITLAQDLALGREVAIKQLRTDRPIESQLLQRFLAEAKIAGRLEHPGIVPVYALGLDQHGHPFYAMKMVRGRTLQEALSQWQKTRSEAGLRDLIRRLILVSQAIAYAHGQQVAHRDLKPTNIMLGDYGETQLLDWGLARPFSAQPESFVGGTPAYMAPEQLRGDPTHDGLCDIFGLGSILFEILTGKPPFQGLDREAIFERLLHGDIPHPAAADIPEPLVAICIKARSWHPQERYPDALRLAEDLQNWLDDQPVSVFPDPWAQRVARWSRRHRASLVGISALLAAGFVALAANSYLLQRERLRSRDSLQETRFYQNQVLQNVRVLQVHWLHQQVEQGQELLALGQHRRAWEVLAEAQGLAQRLGEPTLEINLAQWQLATEGSVFPAYRFPAHKGPCLAVELSGSEAWSIGADGLVQSWDLLLKEPRKSINLGQTLRRAWIKASRAIVLTDQGAAEAWDIPAARRLWRRDRSVLTQMEVAPDGSWILATDPQGRLVRFAAGDELQEILEESKLPAPQQMAIDNGGQCWAVSQAVGLWLNTADHRSTRLDLPPGVQITRLEFPRTSAAARQLIAGTSQGEILVWNLNGPPTLRTRPAHRGAIRGLCLSEKSLQSFGDDRHLVSFDPPGIQEFPAGLSALAMEDSHLLAGGPDGYLEFRQTRPEVSRQKLPPEGEVLDASLAENSETLLLMGHGDHLVLLASERPLLKLEFPGSLVTRAQWAGGRIILVRREQELTWLECWDAVGKKRLWRQGVPSVSTLAVNSKLVAVGSSDGRLGFGAINRLQDGPWHWLEGPSQEFSQLVLSSEPSRLVALSVDGSLRVWDLQRRVPMGSLPAHSASRVSFSSNGEWLAALESPQRMGMYRLDTTWPRRQWQLEGQEFQDMAFGEQFRLMVLSRRGEIRVFNPRQGQWVGRAMLAAESSASRELLGPTGEAMGWIDSSRREFLRVDLDLSERLGSLQEQLVRGEKHPLEASEKRGLQAAWYQSHGMESWAAQLWPEARMPQGPDDWRLAAVRCLWRAGKFSSARELLEIALRDVSDPPPLWKLYLRELEQNTSR